MPGLEVRGERQEAGRMGRTRTEGGTLLPRGHVPKPDVDPDNLAAIGG